MTTDLKAAVLTYLAEHPQTEEYDPYARQYEAPVFRTVHDGAIGARRVEHVSGRPDRTAVSLDLMDAVGPEGGLGWDGQCLTMPGDLRYEPIGLDAHGLAVVCRRVGP